jgi:hypothetical protein
MKTKLVLCSIAFSLAAAVAASNSHNITISNPVWIGTTQLKPGDYKVAVSGDKAVFTQDKKVVAEVPASMATGSSKYSGTQVVSSDSKVEEIDLGGTASKIVFSAGTANGTK